MPIYALAGFAMIGLCAGWLGGMLLKGCGLGLIGNLIVGVLGAFVGGVLVATFGLSAPGAVGSLFAAAIGAACVVLI
jgi:uncharacterized membrane protein YeaQ/YmgE (transglycosylase-associated protein family)